jgi:hypothetical protein
LKRTAELFALSAATGRDRRTGAPTRELACFGARGDGKTFGALWALVLHAVEHEAAGFPLPITVLGVRDTFANHRLTTHKSLTSPAWDGRWHLQGDGHVAVFQVDGQPLVRLELVGVDSPTDADRVRTECHLLWIDEPAPAMALSGGISEELYAIALSSQRLETHARVALLTSNYPEEEHWVWQRFVEAPQPGTAYFRIPAGERASPEYRRELQVAYATRPDLMRRLVLGQPGAVILGEQVAVGFNEEAHAPRGLQLRPDPSATLWLGQDGGLTPTTVIGQREGKRVKVLAALASEHDGIRWHFRSLVLPWLGEHAPWALEGEEALRVVYDPSMDADGQGDTEANPLKIMRATLRATYRPGPVKWEPRHQALLNMLGALELGQPALQIDPVQARGLVRALIGGWHYPTGPDRRVRREEPVKNHPHSDYGDAFCYLLCGLAPGKGDQPAKPPYHARTAFNPIRHGYPRRIPGVGVLIQHRSW